ncbi:DNA internalization-related competence protein ComEC/Rec2 [Staphylococcus muscae]|uniref:DNA internalization-related competence protein ComEC/Rec2 n=2 Tax=Staphylococcus muscae TaxID=1294 RepID=A0A240C2S1_9STAP|nr:DNA internalization-related competence protein ComEC/Rec2 [Staphylococcus muscae]PNZ05583.1 DNA internalization-related competence protein ComEC/Rec2 [Staphylococcus muscae]GGA88845.1 DNA internalization-related competence protein ComEC/Rec2 [Staphylococcus muscae]SNW02411.1 late competence protein ComEC, DNA transport [Staphylococcus muscae]
MIYILLSYIIGQFAYHHILSACFIGLILYISMLIKRQAFFKLMIASLIGVFGYYIESCAPSLPLQQDDLSDISQKVMIHIETLPVFNGDFYHATASIHDRTYHLTFKNYKHTQKQLNAKFLGHYDCIVNAKIKPTEQATSLPSLFVTELDQSKCVYPHQVTFKDRIMMVRNDAIERLVQSNLPGYPFIIALVTGSTDYIPYVQKQLLKDLGISHLFAVSGTHVAIMTGMLYMIGKRCPIPLYFTQICILVILPLFLIFSGNSPSAQRAVAMAFLTILLARFIQQHALLTLLLSYVILSTYQPTIHAHVGFQFSYAICFLLIMLRDSYIHQPFLRATFITSFIAILGTVSISYSYFNEFQWLGLLSNLFFIPLYGIAIIPLSFLVTLIALLIPSLLSLFKLPFYLLFNIHQFLTFCLKPLIRWKLIFPSYGELGYAFCILFIFTTSYLLAKKKWKMLCICVSIFICVTQLCHPQAENRMTLIDVGQGDAILFETTTGQTLLIDTGGERDNKHMMNKASITDRKLYPYFKERGIRRIDYLIITHPHADHMGEISHLSQRVAISNIVINPNHFDSMNFQLVRQVMQEERATLWDFHQLQHLKLGAFSFQFLNADVKQSEDPNEHSIVTLVNINQTKLLLMGDATVNNEEQLMHTYLLPKIDILKVGHHGSKTSSSAAFLEVIKPNHALVSVGKHNMYHLPSPIIIDRFQTYHIPVFSTAELHHIVVSFDKHVIHSYTISHMMRAMN